MQSRLVVNLVTGSQICEDWIDISATEYAAQLHPSKQNFREIGQISIICNNIRRYINPQNITDFHIEERNESVNESVI